jgi:hypothetical protein
VKAKALAALVAVGLMAAADAGPAVGATVVGQVAPTADDASSCGGATLVLSGSVAPGTSTYTVPPGGGILTSWSVQGGDGTSTLELKVVRETAPMDYLIEAQDPTPRTVPAGQLATFDIGIPVEGGEELALWVPDGGHWCSWASTAENALEYRAGSYPEPAPGENFPTGSEEGGLRVNVSAVLEADADGDGFGDESQDGCPQVASTQGPCPDGDADGVADFEDDCPAIAGPAARDGCVLQTIITGRPDNKTKKSKAKFKFVSDVPAATFECRLKGKGLDSAVKQFGPCTSPRTYKDLDPGKYKFSVRAIDAAGADPTPAKDKFKVKK